MKSWIFILIIVSIVSANAQPYFSREHSVKRNNQMQMMMLNPEQISLAIADSDTHTISTILKSLNRQVEFSIEYKDSTIYSAILTPDSPPDRKMDYLMKYGDPDSLIEYVYFRYDWFTMKDGIIIRTHGMGLCYWRNGAVNEPSVAYEQEIGSWNPWVDPYDVVNNWCGKERDE